jgi:RNA polymerase sigma factor (sigma-70 family)
MATHESFWWDANTWWKRIANHLTLKPATDHEWEEARRRLWDLSRRVTEANRLNPENRRDLVQAMLLQLQDPWLVQRLTEVDTPAHYLTCMIRNRLRTEQKQQRAIRQAVRSYAERIQAFDDERPDQRALREEAASEVRFIVNHVVPARDRKLLVWYYWDGLSAAEIGTRLGIREVAVWQRLVRARARVRQTLRV